MPDAINYIAGHRFGSLVYISDVPVEKGRRKGHFLCDCGNEVVLRLNSVQTGNTSSCGCIRKRNAVTHGKSGSPAYRSWKAMLARCYNPNFSKYQEYGARGITVCERWRHSFENFFADMGDRPPQMTIDRHPNVNGNYEPSNCRWATAKEQSNNLRRNVIIEFDGRSMTLAQWSEETGIDYSCLFYRFQRGSWTAEEILTTPSGKIRYSS